MTKHRLFFASVIALTLLAVGPAIALPMDPSHMLAFGLQPDVLSTSHMLAFGAFGSIKQLNALLSKRAGILVQMSALTTAAEGRDDGMLTPDERVAFDTHVTSIAAMDGDIARVRSQIEATRSGASVEVPDGNIHLTDNQRDASTHGFRSFGEFAMACIGASGDGAQVDQRLQIGAASTAPGSYGNTASGQDGGYLIPPEFSSQIVESAYGQNDSFVPLTDSTPVGGNSMTFPVDETTPWGTDGIKAYWTDEAGASTESKGKFEPATLRLKKLTALVPLTEEMLSDGSALASYVQRKVPTAIAFKTNEALWGGNGAGRPKGFYTATNLLVSVAKETSQVADTIVAQNISKMRARMAATSYRRAIWCINNDALPQLDNLLYAVNDTNAVIYNPIGGRYGYGTLLGRDVMVTDFNETVGDKGDIVLVDWGMYRTITKAGGMETTTSMHFWFDRGITAFRTTFRIDGQPAIQAPVTPNKGTNSLSPIVTLDARA